MKKRMEITLEEVMVSNGQMEFIYTSEEKEIEQSSQLKNHDS